MSLAALYSRRPFRPHRQNMETPLAERCPTELLAFVSLGQGGSAIGTVKLTPAGPRVQQLVLNPHTPTMAELPSIAAKVRKFMPRFSDCPTIVSQSYHLDWQLGNAMDFPTTHAYARELRLNPKKLANGADEKLIYTGLLTEGSSKGLILSVGAKEMSAIDEAFAAARCTVVRRTIPALAVLNLMLTSDAVTKERRLPIVVDQGYAIAVTCEDSELRDIQGRPIIGEGSIDLLGDLLEQTRRSSTRTSYVVAASPNNGTADPFEYLTRSGGVDFVPYTIPGVPPQHLFTYATALF